MNSTTSQIIFYHLEFSIFDLLNVRYYIRNNNKNKNSKNMYLVLTPVVEYSLQYTLPHSGIINSRAQDKPL